MTHKFYISFANDGLHDCAHMIRNIQLAFFYDLPAHQQNVHVYVHRMKHLVRKKR
jgi:hypothetical protein